MHFTDEPGDDEIAEVSFFAEVPEEWKRPVTGCKAISPQEARYYRSTYSYTRQRKVTQKLIDEYNRLMQKGDFAPLSDVYFAYFKNDPKKQYFYLVDGNHSCEAIAALNIPFPNMMVKVYECDSMDEVHRLYINLGGGKKRTLHDALRAKGYTSEIRYAKAYIAGFNAFMKSFHQKNEAVYTAMIESTDLLDYTANLCELADKIFEKANNIIPLGRILRRGHILSVIFATLKYQPEDALAFWEQIASSENLERGTPQYALHSFLITSKKSTSPTAVEKDRRGLEARAAARAWNAYYLDKPVNRLNTSTKQSLVILGTPWDGSTPIADMDITLLYDSTIVE